MAKKGQSIAKAQALPRLEKLILRGATNVRDLSAAFNVTPKTISSWLRDIQDNWHESDLIQSDSRRTLRIRQIENVAAIALSSFERSRLDSEEFFIVQKICPKCDGSKQIEVSSKSVTKNAKPTMEDCEDCGATGRITLETTKVKGQAGEAAFLNTALACLKECTRIEGIGPINVREKRETSVFLTGQEAGGKLATETRYIEYEGPAELLLQARSTISQLKKEMDGGGIKAVESKAVESKVVDSPKKRKNK